MVAVSFENGGGTRRKRVVAYSSEGAQFKPRYFHGNRDPESPYFRVEGGVRYKNITLPTAQHHMMLFKAQLFGDRKIAEEVKRTDDATAAKMAASNLKHVDTEVWKRRCLRVAENVTYAKFSRNEDLRKYIIKIRGAFYQSKVKDAFWGIGIEQSLAEAGVAHKGKNHMGKILEKVRSRLQREEELANL